MDGVIYTDDCVFWLSKMSHLTENHFAYGIRAFEGRKANAFSEERRRFREIWLPQAEMAICR